MLIVRSRNKVPIRLTEERWGHITRRHPIMDGRKLEVLQCVRDPDFIQRGDTGEKLAVRRSGKLYMVVPYREVTEYDGFILTGYLTRQYSKEREILWKR